MWLRFLVLAAAVLAALHSRGWATQPLVLADGRTFDVLNFDRHTSIMLSMDGTRETEEMLWVRYYASSSDADAMVAEAKTLAPALFPIADRLGLDILRLSPSRPIFVELLPFGVFSSDVRFERNSAGVWREDPR